MAILADNTTIRDATPADVDFIAWVMLAASRSHLSRGCWEYMLNVDEDVALRFLATLALSERVHLFHHSLFQIAEVDGEPAAAMCGYDPDTQGPQQYGAVFQDVCDAADVTLDDGFGLRVQVFVAGWPDKVAERPWVVENVATRPEFRRRGLTDLLLRQTLERGHSNGFRQAQVGVYIGNEAARSAYLKAGFVVVAESRDARWDAEIGCPGTELLLQSI